MITAFQDDKRFLYDSRLVTMPFLLLYFSFLQQLDAKIENIKAFFSSHNVWKYMRFREHLKSGRHFFYILGNQ